jgi:hypothetical protein
LVRESLTLDFVQENLTRFLPILYGEVLNVGVARSFGGTVGIHHFDGRLIRYPQRCRWALSEENQVGEEWLEGILQPSRRR